MEAMSQRGRVVRSGDPSAVDGSPADGGSDEAGTAAQTGTADLSRNNADLSRTKTGKKRTGAPCRRCGAEQSAIRINVDGNTLLMESCDNCDIRRWQLEGERIDLHEALNQVGEHAGRRRTQT